MAELEDREFKTLKLRVDHDVAMAYQNMRPLLTENVAISKYIQAKQDLSLRQALPEITTISEAAIVASMDYPLSQTQQASLMKLLKAEYD